MMIAIAIPQYRHWNFPFALLNSLDKSMPFDECGAFSMNSAAPVASILLLNSLNE